jgi:hypothetical protein
MSNHFTYLNNGANICSLNMKVKGGEGKARAVRASSFYIYTLS